MNKVQLVGRITKDIELKATQNQTPYINFTLAVERRFKDANGNRQADFINCVAWKSTAQFIQKYFKKGSRLGACGTIQTRSYDDQNGQKHFITEVLVEEAEFVEINTAAEPQANEPTPPPEAPAALPFEI